MTWLSKLQLLQTKFYVVWDLLVFCISLLPTSMGESSDQLTSMHCSPLAEGFRRRGGLERLAGWLRKETPQASWVLHCGVQKGCWQTSFLAEICKEVGA